MEVGNDALGTLVRMDLCNRVPYVGCSILRCGWNYIRLAFLQNLRFKKVKGGSFYLVEYKKKFRQNNRFFSQVNFIFFKVFPDFHSNKFAKKKQIILFLIDHFLCFHKKGGKQKMIIEKSVRDFPVVVFVVCFFFIWFNNNL